MCFIISSYRVGSILLQPKACSGTKSVLYRNEKQGFIVHFQFTTHFVGDGHCLLVIPNKVGKSVQCSRGFPEDR